MNKIDNILVDLHSNQRSPPQINKHHKARNARLLEGEPGSGKEIEQVGTLGRDKVGGSAWG